MKKLLVIVISGAVFTSCSKDKFKTEPQVAINSFGPDEVTYGQTIDLKATVTDKEGDLQDTIYVVRKRFNGQNLLTVDTATFNISNFGFPNKQSIELELQFSYGQIVDGKITQSLEDAADRNFAVGLIVQDKAGHKSSYVESKQIVLKKG